MGSGVGAAAGQKWSFRVSFRSYLGSLILCTGAALGACRRRHSRAIRQVSLKTSVKLVSKSSCLDQGVICCLSGRLCFLCAGAVLGARHRRPSRAIRKVLFKTSVKIVSESIFCSKGLALQIVPDRIYGFSARSPSRSESKCSSNGFRKGLIRLGRVRKRSLDPIKCPRGWSQRASNDLRSNQVLSEWSERIANAIQGVAKGK